MKRSFAIAERHPRWVGFLFPALLVLGLDCSSAAGQKQKSGKVLADSHMAVAVAISPDGRLLAAGGFDKAIFLWDARTGNVLRSLEGPKRTTRGSIAFSPDGKMLFGCGNDGVVHRWNTQTGVLERSYPGPTGVDSMSSIARSPDGKKLAVVYTRYQNKDKLSPCEMTVLDAQTGKILWSRSQDKHIYSVRFAPDGKAVAVADGTVHLLHAGSGEAIKELHVKDRLALHVAFSPDGKSLAAVGGHSVKVGIGTVFEGELFMWELQTGDLLHRITDLQPWPASIVFSSDGKTLATGSSGPFRETKTDRRVTSEIRLWEAQSGRLLRTIPGALGRVSSLAFSPDGKSLLSCDYDEVALTETLTGLRRLTLTNRPSALSESPVDLKRGWADLANADGAEAYRAMGRLASAAKESAPFLNEQLQPIASISPRRVSQLIVSLESEQFVERENAQRELEKLQDLAVEELNKALAGKPSPEARRRIEGLLEKADLLKNPERLRVMRAIEVLENISTSEAKRTLERLAEGAAQAQQTREAKASLERLAKRTRPAPLP
jgi:Tol biopolymer transport system component